MDERSEKQRSEQSESEQPRRRNIVVGKAQGEWGDTLPAAQVDTMAGHDDNKTKASHPPIIGIEEIPPAN